MTDSEQTYFDDVTLFTKKLRSRADSLSNAANLFLFIIFVVLIGAIVAVVFASKIASEDIDYIVQLKSTQNAIIPEKQQSIVSENNNIASYASSIKDIRNKITDGSLGKWREWATLTTRSPSTSIDKAFFFDTQRGWLLSRNKGLFYTDDGGQNWQTIPLKSGIYVRDLHLINPGLVWLVSSNKIYRTQNSGNQWQIIATLDELPPLPAQIEAQPAPLANYNDASFSSIYFLNSENGWIAVNDGRVYATRDSGNTWQLRNSSSNEFIQKIKFIDRQFGVALSYGNLIVTKDGGVTWRQFQIDLPGSKRDTDPIVDFDFIDKNTIAILLKSGQLYFTENGNATWQYVQTGYGGKFVSASLPDRNTGWLVYESGTIVHTRKHDTAIDKNLSNQDFLEYIQGENAPFFVHGKSYIADLKDRMSSTQKSTTAIARLTKDINTFTKTDESLAKVESQWYFAAATNGIRFGILVVSFFLVQIMVSLYRYNKRLAGLYHAFADAIQLTPLTNREGVLQSDSLVQLVQMLSPDQLDFGKTPTVITEKLIDSLRDVARSKSP